MIGLIERNKEYDSIGKDQYIRLAEFLNGLGLFPQVSKPIRIKDMGERRIYHHPENCGVAIDYYFKSRTLRLRVVGYYEENNGNNPVHRVFKSIEDKL